MPTMPLGLTLNIGQLVNRLPSWRDATAFRIRRSSRAQQADIPLAQIIESEIIPRLLVAHRSDLSATTGGVPGAAVLPADIERFAPHLVQRETCELIVELDALLARGFKPETLLVDLFAPAARLLGEGWEVDRYDLVDVTMALWRLQELVHELVARYPAPRPPAAGRRALFAAAPGDQHSLGVTILEEMFRLAGWDASSVTDADENELALAVESEWFDVLGLTITQREQLVTVPGLIALLRRRSRNPGVLVMIGGAAINGRPEFAAEAGADGTAADARAAVAWAEQLIGASAAAAYRC